jgi:ribosomal protein S18 acetylase RimI-like enzyme
MLNLADRPYMDDDSPGWYTVEESRSEWTEPDFDLSADTRAAIDADGQIVAYQEVFSTPPHVRIIQWGKVHPEYLGRGIGTALLEWSGMRAEEVVARAPEGTAVTAQAWVSEDDQASKALLTDFGFERTRFFWDMKITLDERPEVPALGGELEFRPFNRETDHRATHDAIHDSFRDHYGYAEGDADERFKRSEHALDSNPNYDPKHFHVIWDGDEVAGASMCYPNSENDPRRGYVATLGVREAWRGRGLGLALLLQSFQTFWDNGAPIITLGVDADSLTGATRLYEKAGMRVSKEFSTYDRKLRDGREMSRPNAGRGCRRVRRGDDLRFRHS